MGLQDILFGQVVPFLHQQGYLIIRYDYRLGVASRRFTADAVAYDAKDRPILLVEIKAPAGRLGISIAEQVAKKGKNGNGAVKFRRNRGIGLVERKACRLTLKENQMASFLSKLFGTRSRRSTAPRRTPRPSFRPGLEVLEDRRLCSTSGVISSITDRWGTTNLFEIGQNGQIFWRAKDSSWDSSWQQLSQIPGGFKEISAALDPHYGSAYCYGICANDGSLVIQTPNYQGGGNYYWLWAGGVAKHISGTRNGECYAIGTDNALYVNSYVLDGGHTGYAYQTWHWQDSTT